MMELTVLGSHSPYAPANGACSGYLLTIDGFHIMLDCGNGSFSRLQRHIDFAELDMVIITHLHPDHYSDIYCLRQAIGGAIKSGRRQQPVILYVPEEPSALAEEIREWTDIFNIASLSEAMAHENDFNLFQLDFFRTKHEPETYGLRISQGGQPMFAYTSDTGWYSGLIQECAGVRLLLAEASLKEHELQTLGDRHMTAGQAGMLAQAADAGKLILTHFFPTYNLHQLQREAEQHFDQKVLMATMGKTYTIEGKTSI